MANMPVSVNKSEGGSGVAVVHQREQPSHAGTVARASAVSPLIEAGNVYLQHPHIAPWVNDFIEECASFPNGKNDDMVDAMSQILLRWNMLPRQPVVYIDWDEIERRNQISPI